MSFQAEVIKDSITEDGCRLTTIVATYPRIIHSEVMTHRDRARNAASSRAIPLAKMIEAVQSNPFVPIVFGSEKKGMQTGGSDTVDQESARIRWMASCRDALSHATELGALGVHKSICNRILEPYSWITVVMTATEWENFFRLRCHTDAEIHFQKIAGMIRDARNQSSPNVLKAGMWHLPFVSDDELSSGDLGELKMCSVARCARVSYLNHNKVPTVAEDITLFNRLVEGSGFGHWSAHEHVACAYDRFLQSGPYRGWRQYRKEFPGENVEG